MDLEEKIPEVSCSGPWNPLAPAAYVLPSARNVLDCGCGDGSRGVAIKARCAGRVVGVESDTGLLELARARLDEARPAGRWYCPLPFDDASFDCVVCDGALARVRDHEALIAEFVRVLVAGGLLIATFPNLQYYRTVHMLACEGEWRREKEGILADENLRFFTAQEVFAALHRAKLVKVKCAPLTEDVPETLPLDARNHIHFGRMTIGPLDRDEYRMMRTQQFIAFGVKKDR